MEYVLSIIGVPSSSLKRAFSPLGSFGRHIADHFIPHARNNYHPHILGHRALALSSALLVAVKIFTIALISFGPITPAFSSAITPDNIINLTNESRVQYTEAALTENTMLDKAAQAKADDMLAKGYFAHVTPDGRTPWSFIVAAGYNYLEAGENLAVNFTEAENVETAWMNSPDHKANILNKNFQEIGVGISQGQYQGHNAIFVVQEFGTPAEQSIALSDVPTKVQPAAVPAPAKVPAPALEPSVTQQANPVEVRGDATKVAQAPAAEATVESGSVMLDGSNIDISAQVSGPATKVIAYFGQRAIMLLPQNSAGSWSGQVAVSGLAQSNSSVHLEAFNIDGKSSQIQLADFSASTISNYNLAGTAPASSVTFLGLTFNPNVFQNQFYLLFMAVLITSLILAIAIKRHIQHLPLIANASFVIIFATLLWFGG